MYVCIYLYVCIYVYIYIRGVWVYGCMGVWVFLYTHIYGVCAPTHREDKRHRKSEESREVRRQAGRQADRHRYIQADRQTDRQIDRQIDRKDRQTDIHILRRGGRGSISKKDIIHFVPRHKKTKTVTKFSGGRSSEAVTAWLVQVSETHIRQYHFMWDG